MPPSSLLAIDLGAESGRAMIGKINDSQITLEEVHRFPNAPVRIDGHLYWDILRIYSDILIGLQQAVTKCGGTLDGMAIDTWGVDFGLLDRKDQLIGNPFHYRDPRTDGMVEIACQLAGRSTIYKTTGIQFMQLNSLYQLLSMVMNDDLALRNAHSFLNIPDLLNFWLSGHKSSEFTIATTTQCFDPVLNNWAYDLLPKLGINGGIFQNIIQPGTIIDQIHESIAKDAGCTRVPLIATASHDTASAVAAVPAQSDDFIYISSGTWSLMGIETKDPIISEQSLNYNITNEGGVNGTYRFLKNIMGMWLVQECRREWSRQGNQYTYDDLTDLARQAPGLKSLIPPGDEMFLAPGNMVERIQEFCSKTKQPVPQRAGEIIRCILESLALEYRWVADRLEELAFKKYSVIHIIGGGSRNYLLNQFTADATGRLVVSGPVEATAIGNILVQALALGKINSLQDGRAIVRQSFNVALFEPGSKQIWDDAYQRYLQLSGKLTS